jgi:hypothetical protein
MKIKTKIIFPSICTTLGGAEWVTVYKGYAKIKIPQKVNPVTLSLSVLPDPDHWTAFNLADAANKVFN